MGIPSTVLHVRQDGSYRRNLKRLLKWLTSRAPVAPLVPDRDTAFSVYRVRLPEGERDVVSLLPREVVFKSGLASEAIVGVCTELLKTGDHVTPLNFMANKVFVDLLHNVIETHAPELPELQAEARRQHTGCVALIDGRTPTPAGDVPPHDIFGAFDVRDGMLVPHSYHRSHNHRLLSSDGLFKLSSPILEEKLIEEMIRATKSQTAENSPIWSG